MKWNVLSEMIEDRDRELLKAERARYARIRQLRHGTLDSRGADDVLNMWGRPVKKPA